MWSCTKTQVAWKHCHDTGLKCPSSVDGSAGQVPCQFHKRSVWNSHSNNTVVQQSMIQSIKKSWVLFSSSVITTTVILLLTFWIVLIHVLSPSMLWIVLVHVSSPSMHSVTASYSFTSLTIFAILITLLQRRPVLKDFTQVHSIPQDSQPGPWWHSICHCNLRKTVNCLTCANPHAQPNNGSFFVSLLNSVSSIQTFKTDNRTMWFVWILEIEEHLLFACGDIKNQGVPACGKHQCV